MDRTQFQKIIEQFLSAWNSQDIERLIACFTDDFIYCDPNTRGEISNKDALRRFFKKLFGNWQMEWSLRDVYLFSDKEGGVLFWHAKFRKTDQERTVEANGVDLVLVRNNLIERSETYFDRSVLTPLL
jgi:ketosteroid isomerase-like protein